MIPTGIFEQPFGEKGESRPLGYTALVPKPNLFILKGDFLFGSSLVRPLWSPLAPRAPLVRWVHPFRSCSSAHARMQSLISKAELPGVLAF